MAHRWLTASVVLLVAVFLVSGALDDPGTSIGWALVAVASVGLVVLGYGRRRVGRGVPVHEKRR